MKLPAADRVTIEAPKVRDYLLSPTHPVGRFKASFFTALGYRQDRWQVLASDLQRLAITGDASQGDATAYGQKYEVRGNLIGPSGRSAGVVSVWIVRSTEAVPRFVTAFPVTKP